jgi:hypothetical protein
MQGHHSHHAEGLVDPNSQYKKTVTGFRYPRALAKIGNN